MCSKRPKAKHLEYRLEYFWSCVAKCSGRLEKRLVQATCVWCSVHGAPNAPQTPRMWVFGPARQMHLDFTTKCSVHTSGAAACPTARQTDFEPWANCRDVQLMLRVLLAESQIKSTLRC